MADLKEPPRSWLLGLLADAGRGVVDFADRTSQQGGTAGQVGTNLRELLGLLSVPAIARTVDRMSYGEPLTTGRGMTTKLRPDTAEAAMAVAPVAGKYPRAALGLATLGADGGALNKAIFAGVKAKTADKAALARAQAMESSGADPRAIWGETGWFKGGDGKWRFEIDDSAAKFNPSMQDGRVVENAIQRGDTSLDLGPTVGSGMSNLLSHRTLSEAYGASLPQHTTIGNKNTMFGDGVQGFYDDVTDTLQVNAPATAEQARSTMLHELQHAIQGREGFSVGGSSDIAFRDPRMYGKKGAEGSDVARKMLAERLKQMQTPMPIEQYAKNAWGESVITPEIEAAYREYAKGLKTISPSIVNEAQKSVAQDWYRRLAGEAEARAVQARMSMTPEQRRATFPLDSYDVPLRELIYRGVK